ncbi:acyl-CoA dehydrogenase [Chlorogloeopsis sp. ULAP01]|uniref:acyl-CoA dehydrogenase n=1 Tax=Chlorogloeopsis sp. ULAP01 TaxID=3056483 RepID=UPI0025AB28D4|nr:acyl-CoA dehydrogenase [Chlorogloeopsis sp. ULAP01]MDM9384586.1 acyl-CoA dehydrogenase [Chlorogloeopsis sp. ULAP01]
MNFLKPERTILTKFLPDLDEKLAYIPLLEMEKPQNPAIKIFRELGGPGLLIPTKYKGLGATPVEAVRIQRAIASRAPSLAIATTMHHFSVATIVEMIAQGSGTGFEWMLLEGIAKQNLYVASGFAEGRTGAGILSPNMQVKRTADGVTVSGSKKPCSLSASMDLLTASVSIPSKSGDGSELAVVIIPTTNTTGTERRPFWTNSVLAGAESDEVVLHDVKVPEQLISYTGSAENLDYVQTRGFLWFEMLISASYLGIASALVERTIAAGKGTPSERTILAIEVEGAMAALEGLAQSMMVSDSNQGSYQLARALFVRYAVQGAIERVTAHAVELLGGMAFISSPEVAYLFTAARPLAFHPPSRLSISPALDKYLAGETLLIQ